MKAIMISIKPKWVAKILNGEKTIEIRKTMPKCDLPIDVYIYCTKNKDYLTRGENDKVYPSCCISNGIQEWHLNGKVVAKFTLNKVETIRRHNIMPYYLNEDSVCKKSCLTFVELRNYLKCQNGYAWHISNLEIFDEPKELSEFEHYNLTEKSYRRFPYCDFKLTKAPQSWQFIESEK